MLFRAASILFGTVLRAAGDTKTPMRVGIIVNIVNVVLNFFLIFPTRTVAVFNVTFTLYGAGMGVIGAAVASAVAFAVGGILMKLAVWKHPTVSPRGCSLYPDKEVKVVDPYTYYRLLGESLENN
jgi:Na+-driven multidrug efflux pump